MKKNCLVVVSGCTVLRAQDRVRRVEGSKDPYCADQKFWGRETGFQKAGPDK